MRIKLQLATFLIGSNLVHRVEEKAQLWGFEVQSRGWVMKVGYMKEQNIYHDEGWLHER